MKISKIEYENFRNFRDRGEFCCSTDGKVTIIYGKNGDGKTTLHQLFQWVFYGHVHFNKTTTDRLYNHQYESEQPIGTTFDVFGCIDFEHDSKQYSVRRTYTYKKGLNESAKIADDFSVSMMDEDNNWRRMDNPKECIEKLLPSGLSDYFFFDGESMIADLRVKGRDSAVKLRRALYSMFDLDILEAAINDLGRTDLKTTVIGKLYLSKGTIASGGEIAKIKTDIEGAQAKLERIDANLRADEKRKVEFQGVSQQVSEQIGGHKSKADYERQRKILKGQRDLFIRNASDAQAEFGDAVLDMFPQLLIAKAVKDAKRKISLKIERNKLPTGVSKKLISYLLENGTTECICGRPLCQNEREHIRSFLNMLPPKSYSTMYNEFVQTARNWGRGYDPARIEDYIIRVLDNNEQASECDRQIRELDEAEKKSPDIETLIITRQEAEVEIARLEDSIREKSTERKKFDIYLKRRMQDFDKLTRESAEGARVAAKITIMEQVVAHFRQRLEQESLEYSQRLEENIQMLIDNMLTSRRTVTVSPEFAVRITDSFNDESKSEGQFAVVSFAYIGGILKMLRSEEHLKSKEYPLVLDGPFSKLDPDQRQNVVNMLPTFAPQVFLFSKDDLQGVFPEASIGRVWTIVSNDEKNVAKVEEGHLWS